jgi:hypothetical protein
LRRLEENAAGKGRDNNVVFPNSNEQSLESGYNKQTKSCNSTKTLQYLVF